MQPKIYLLILSVLLLLFQVPECTAQLSSDPGARINNPLGGRPFRLHLGRGAVVLSALTGVAYFINKKNKDLEDKRLSFYLENGVMYGYKFPFTIIPETNLGVNYKVTKWLAYGADIGVYTPRDEFNQSTGISMLRVYNKFYLRDTDKFRLWFENGVGVVYFTKLFPVANPQEERFGTNWNGVVKYGLGAEVNINPSLSILLGVRHLHFSNAEIKGKARNPSADSHGIFVGMNYNPRRDQSKKKDL